MQDWRRFLLEQRLEFQTLDGDRTPVSYSTQICDVDILLLDKVGQLYEGLGSHVAHKVSKGRI